MVSCVLELSSFYGIFNGMTLTSNQSCDRDGPLYLKEPELAAGAEKIARDIVNRLDQGKSTST